MNEETTQLNGAEDRSIKSDGTDHWYEAYKGDPELANSPVLASFKTAEDALKGLVELKAYQGRSVRLLGEDATPEERAAWVEKVKTHIPGVTIMPKAEDAEDFQRFQQELGVPKDNAYETPADVKFEGLDENGIDQARQVSIRAGHTQKQHNEFLASINELNLEMQEKQAEFLKNEDAKLTQAWGDAREQNEGIVNGLVKKFEDEGVPLGDINNAGKLMLFNIAKAMSSDPQTFSQVNNPMGKHTPAEIRARQNDLFQQLNKDGGRKLKQEGTYKRILGEYKKTFDDLAQYKQT